MAHTQVDPCPSPNSNYGVVVVVTEEPYAKEFKPMIKSIYHRQLGNPIPWNYNDAANKSPPHGQETRHCNNRASRIGIIEGGDSFCHL